MEGVQDRLRDALAERYTVERELGRGGMATVYLARDLKHDRHVALKVLRPELAAALGRERFLREIEIAAKLSHPHIVALFDSGEAGGFLYYVMPYVEGESLRDRLERAGPLPIADAVTIGRQVADALEYAHRQGIVHRDIKPANILLTGRDALVADFGIATAVAAAETERLTESGLAVGTPAYMSPEQAAGEGDLDARSDIYALGCVLYEMLAGAPPFTDQKPESVRARHLLDPAPPLRTVRPTVPGGLERAVLTALAKSPADRFSSAAALERALSKLETRSAPAVEGAPAADVTLSGPRRLVREIHRRSLWQVLLIYIAGSWAAYEVIDTITDRLLLPEWLPVLAIVLFLIGLPIVLATAFVQEGPPTATVRGPPVRHGGVGSAARSGSGGGRARRVGRWLTWRNAVMGGVLAFALWGFIAAVSLVLETRTEAASGGGEAAPALAVLPFTVRGEGLELWREGMVDVLSTNLAGVPGLRAIPSRTVLARWARIVPSRGPADLATVLSVAERVGARYAVVGRMIASGSSVRLDIELYEVGTREILEQVQMEGVPDGILHLVDELSLRIVRSIGSGVVEDVPNFNLARATTASVEALKAYLKGEAHFRRSEWEGAAESYEEAIGFDSTFALAHYRLLEAYGWADGGHGGRVRSAAERAERLAGDQPLPVYVQAFLAEVAGAPDAIALAERAVQERPEDAHRWSQLGEAYAHRGGTAMAEPGSERRAFARAVELDPGMTHAYFHLIASTFRLNPDSARIAELIDQYEAHGAAADQVLELRTAHALAFGDSAARSRAYANIDGWPLTPGAIARWVLSHPRFLPQRAQVFRIASHRRDHLEPWFSDWLVVRTAFDRGRIREALRELKARELRESFLLPTVFRVYVQGLPLPESVIDSILGLDVADTIMTGEYILLDDGGNAVPLLYTAAYAVSQGVPNAASDAIVRLRRAAGHHREAGDTIRARIALGAAQALQGFDAWRNGGDLSRARRLLEEVRAGGLFDQWQNNRTVRWWLAEVLMESGRPGEAVPYYISLVEGEPSGLYDPPAWYRLGQAYERLGDLEEARRSYDHFLLAWRDADPELQPWIEDARRARARLARDR